MTSVEVDVDGQRPEVAHRRQLSFDVVGRRADHHPQERQPSVSAQSTDDPEVEQRRATIGEHEEVAAVQIAVEHAVDHRPFDECDHRRAHDGLGVDTSALHARNIVEVESVDPLHHQHSAGDQCRVWAGHDVAGLLQLVEHHGNVDHVGGFHAEVELLDDRLGEQLDQCRGIGQRRDRDPADEVRRQPGHDPQVLAHQAGDARSLHLDDHVLAAAQRCRVHLGDRGRGQRRAIEDGEDALERHAEVFLDHLADRIERFGGHLVAALLELLDELRREQPFAAGDDLAKLDVRRAEPFGGAAQSPEMSLRLASGVA